MRLLTFFVLFLAHSALYAEFICEGLSVPKTAVTSEMVGTNNNTDHVNLDLLQSWHSYKMKGKKPYSKEEQSLYLKDSQSLLITKSDNLKTQRKRVSLIEGYRGGFAKFSDKESETIKNFYRAHTPTYLKKGSALRFETERETLADGSYKRKYFVQYIDCSKDEGILEGLNSDSRSSYLDFANQNLKGDGNIKCVYGKKKSCQFIPDCMNFSETATFNFNADSGFSSKDNVIDHCAPEALSDYKKPDTMSDISASALNADKALNQNKNNLEVGDLRKENNESIIGGSTGKITGGKIKAESLAVGAKAL